MRLRLFALLLAGAACAVPAVAQETREMMRERGWGKALADLATSLDLTSADVLDVEHHEPSNVTSAWLENGVRLHVRPAPEATNLVDATIVLAGGMILESEAERGLTIAAAQLANRSALPGRSLDESRQYLGAGGVRVTVQGRTDAIVIRIRGDSILLDGALAVVHELLSGARLDESQLTQWKRAQQSQLDAAGTSPAATLTNLVWETIFAGARSPLVPLSHDEIGRVELLPAQRWFDLHAREAPMEVAISGDIDAGDALHLAAKFLGTLPARERISPQTHASRRAAPMLSAPAEAEAFIDSPRVEDVIALGHFGVDGRDRDHARALQAATMVLRRQIDRKLMGDAGITRASNVLPILNPEIPGAGLLLVAALSAPEKFDQLEPALRAEVDAFLTSGPEAADFAEIMDQIIGGAEQSLEDPGYWSEQLGDTTYRGKDLEDLARQPDLLAALTPEALREAFAKAWTGGRPVKVVIRSAPLDEPVGQQEPGAAEGELQPPQR